MSWVPTTEQEREEMLETIGVSSIDDLFAMIPAQFRLQSWDVPAGISEMAVRDKLRTISEKNSHPSSGSER